MKENANIGAPLLHPGRYKSLSYMNNPSSPSWAQWITYCFYSSILAKIDPILDWTDSLVFSCS